MDDQMLNWNSTIYKNRSANKGYKLLSEYSKFLKKLQAILT